MNILVTGGCGFIGSHIVDAYLTLGHKVTIIDNLSTGNIKNLNPRAIFYQEDIRHPEIEKIFAQHQFDVINHHAAQINVRTAVDDPLYDADINIMGSLRLLTCAQKYKVARFIFASSGGAAYGEPGRFPIDESFPINPLSPYGLSKITIEQYLALFSRLFSLESVILRYSNVYGPRQISTSEAGVISIFIHNILHNTPCVVFGDGSDTRDYVYIDDVVQANIKALACAPDTFNIGTGIETTVNELIQHLGALVGHEIAHTHAAARLGDLPRNVLNAGKAKETLSWLPEISLKEGIKRTFDYFSQRHALSQEVS
jgi:UDP-glucose 4-epimerase